MISKEYYVVITLYTILDQALEDMMPIRPHLERKTEVNRWKKFKGEVMRMGNKRGIDAFFSSGPLLTNSQVTLPTQLLHPCSLRWPLCLPHHVLFGSSPSLACSRAAVSARQDPAEQTEEQQSMRSMDRACSAAPWLLALGLYLNTLNADFAYDDRSVLSYLSSHGSLIPSHSPSAASAHHPTVRTASWFCWQSVGPGDVKWLGACFVKSASYFNLTCLYDLSER